MAFAKAEHGLSERQACKLLELGRSSYRYEPELDRNEKLRDALIDLARQKPRYGYRRLAVLLREQGWEASTNRVQRIYKAEKLAVRRLKRKRLRQWRFRPSRTAIRRQGEQDSGVKPNSNRSEATLVF